MSGIRVIDTATLVAGPVIATNFGELGADVIKIEQPNTGDPLRSWGDCKNGVGLVWKSVSRNKRCVTLDLRQPAGQDLLHRLLDISDVLILGSRPSALKRWGLGPADISARHPQLVIVHVSGYGAGGPDADKPGYGTLAEAMSGFAHLVGEPDRPPSLPPFMLADGVAAQTACNAVLAALYHRDVHGAGGQYIDVNLVEPLARLIESATLAYDQLGRIPVRGGSRFDASAPRNCYRTSDARWLAMSSASPRMAQRVFTVVERPDLAADPAYYEPAGRSENGDEIDRLVAEWIEKRTLAEALEAFESSDCAVTPVFDARDLMENPHLSQRGMFVRVQDPELGEIRVQSPVARLSETPGVIKHLGPKLGAHNEAVYRELLQLTDEEIHLLSAAGTI